LLSLENQTPVLTGSTVELEGEEPVVVGPSQPYRIYGRDGSNEVTEAIQVLAKNGLLRLERRDGVLRISRGEHVPRLITVKQGAPLPSSASASQRLPRRDGEVEERLQQPRHADRS